MNIIRIFLILCTARLTKAQTHRRVKWYFSGEREQLWLDNSPDVCNKPLT